MSRNIGDVSREQLLSDLVLFSYKSLVSRYNCSITTILRFRDDLGITTEQIREKRKDYTSDDVNRNEDMLYIPPRSTILGRFYGEYLTPRKNKQFFLME